MRLTNIEPSKKKDLFIFFAVLLSVLLAVPIINYKKIMPNKKLTKKTNELKSIKTSANIASIALLANGRVASQFIKPLSIPLSKNLKPEYIVYGNKDFGYFQSDDFSLDKETLKINLTPPTFKTKINICVKYKNKPLELVLSKRFKNPAPVILKNIRLVTDGDFTHNFFLLAAQFVPDETSSNDRAYLPVIANKYGEVIWAHLPQNGKVSFRKYPVIKKLQDGDYGILFGEKYSYFELFDFKGNIKEFVFPKEAETPYVVHHDFIYLKNSKIMTLGHKVHYVRNWLGIKNKFLKASLSLLKPTSFLSTTVEVVDVSKNKNSVLWDPIQSFNPVNDLSWARDNKDAKLNLEGPPRHFSLWNKPRVNVDWTHANTLEHYPGIGILVSLRNLSRVVLLDEKTHEVIWSLGNSKEDTFQTLNESHAFYHQHHVQILKTGHIMMMDNHTAPPATRALGSRVLIYGLNETSKKAQVIWNYQPSDKVKIGNRGSAYQLENKNVIAFYPASLGLMDHLIEVDQKNGQPIAHMKIFFTDVKRNFSKKQLRQIKESGHTPLKKIREGGGNRAVPINTIGKEKRIKSDVICSH